jgi:hypothetical protein
MALGRCSTTDDVPGFVSYFTSDQAGYVTGASLSIDGSSAAQVIALHEYAF